MDLTQAICASISEHDVDVDIPPSTFRSWHVDLPLPDFNVNRFDDGLFNIVFEEFHDAASTYYGTIKREKEEPQPNFCANTFQHDYTFGIFAANTDKKFGEVIPNLKEMAEECGLEMRIESLAPGLSPSYTYKALLNMSPDYYEYINETHVFVEFASSRSMSRRVVESEYQKKREKYENCVRNINKMVNEKIALFIIVASPIGVATNLAFDEHIIEELTARVKIGIEASCKLQDQGDMIPYVNEASADLKDFSATCASIKPDFKGFFDKERYSNALSAVDPEEIETIWEKIWQKAATDFVRQEPSQLISKGTLAQMLRKMVDNNFSTLQEKAEIENPTGFQTHLKSVVNLPFLDMAPGASSLSVKNSSLSKLVISSNDTTSSVWNKAINNMNLNPDFIDNLEFSDNFFNFEDDSIQSDEVEGFDRNLEYAGPKPSDMRQYYSRVRVNIPEADMIELGKVGFKGKRLFKDGNETILSYRREKKKPFNIEKTNTDDIESLMNSKYLNDLLTPSSHKPVSETLECIQRLISKALGIHRHPFSANYEYYLRRMTYTPFYRFSKIVSDIATELVLSLRQNCKSNQLILKKLKDYNIFLLIKPTSVKAGLNFSILWYNKDLPNHRMDFGNVFRAPHSDGNVSWTDFISVSQTKLENWALMEGRMLALIPYWTEFHNCAPFTFPTEEFTVRFNSSSQMIMLSLLTALADKSEIEKEQSLFRFIFMKSLAHYPRTPDFYKVIDEMNMKPRSRLTVWVQKKLKQYMYYSCEGRLRAELIDPELTDFSQTTVTTKGLVWKGLMNPYNSQPLDNPGQIVNLMYIGYVQNKNLGLELNALGDLLKKILVYEEDYTEEIRKRVGKVNKEFNSKTKHEYNVDLLKKATDFCFKEYLPKMNGKSFFEKKIADIFNHIAGVTIESVFTTLKASTNFGYKFFEITKERYHRLKVIEKVQEYVHDPCTKVVHILITCYSEVKQNGFMRIDIFAKNQHGGKREIYVLGFAERALQWFIESISRGLCALFPGETMVNPENKTKLPAHHFNYVKKAFPSGKVITVCDSSDASKWSQNHLSLKFAQMLVRILPKAWHGIIWNSLEFWDNKFIMVPQSLTDLLDKKDDMKFHNEFMDKYYKAFKGYESCSWADQNKCFIKTKSGMMQGILHYTSSLFHSVLNKYVEHIQISAYKKVTGQPLIVTTLQSSDDSCQIVSYEADPVNQPEITSIISESERQSLVCILMSIKAIMCEELAIIDSDKKSARHICNGYEFNSAFHFGASRTEPELKFLYSSLITTERENIVDRMEETYTQLTNFLSAGGSSYSATFIQIGQAFFNYRTLGSSVTTRFSLLSRLLKVVPDPNLGFFPLDNPLVTGILGFKYNVWKLSRTTNVGILHKYLLNEALDTSLVDERTGKRKYDESKMKNSIIVKQCTIMFGQRMKLRQLLNRMDLPKDWVAKVEEKPEILYRSSLNTEEFKLKCAIKMHSPGVSESLSTGNSTSRILAAGAYILKSTVMKPVSDWNQIITSATESTNEVGLGPENEEKSNIAEERAFSLMQVAIAETFRVLRAEDPDVMNDEDLKLLYPYHSDYVMMESKLDLMRELNIVRKTFEFRRVVVKLEVFSNDMGFTIPPIESIKHVWFPSIENRTRFSDRLMNTNFQALQNQIRWLSWDVDESLRLSPFHSHLEMYNWLYQLTEKTRIVTLVGAPVSTKRGQTNINSIVKQNFHRFQKLVVRSADGLSYSDTSLSYVDLRHIIATMLSYPASAPMLYNTMIPIFKSYSDKLVFNDTHNRSRYNSLFVFTKASEIITGKFENEEEKLLKIKTLFDFIKRAKLGVIGGYVKPQKYIKGKGYDGEGIWAGEFWGTRVRIHVTSVSHIDPYGCDVSRTVISAIEYDNDFIMSDFEFCLREWCRDNFILDRTIDTTGDYSRMPEHRSIPRFFKGKTVIDTHFFNRGRITHGTIGIPILKLSNGDFFEINLTYTDIDIEFEMRDEKCTGAVKLLAVERRDRSRNKMTIMRYFSQLGDIKNGPHLDEELKVRPEVRKWITFDCLDAHQANAVITVAMNSRDRPLFTEFVRSLMKTAFNSNGLRMLSKPVSKPIYNKLLKISQKADFNYDCIMSAAEPVCKFFDKEAILADPNLPTMGMTQRAREMEMKYQNADFRDSVINTIKSFDTAEVIQFLAGSDELSKKWDAYSRTHNWSQFCIIFKNMLVFWAKTLEENREINEAMIASMDKEISELDEMMKGKMELESQMEEEAGSEVSDDSVVLDPKFFDCTLIDHMKALTKMGEMGFKDRESILLLDKISEENPTISLCDWLENNDPEAFIKVFKDKIEKKTRVPKEEVHDRVLSWAEACEIPEIVPEPPVSSDVNFLELINEHGKLTDELQILNHEKQNAPSWKKASILKRIQEITDELDKLDQSISHSSRLLTQTANDLLHSNLEQAMTVIQMGTFLEPLREEEWIDDTDLNFLDSNLIAYQPSKVQQMNLVEHVRHEHPWLKNHISVICAERLEDFRMLFRDHTFYSNFKETGLVDWVEFVYPDITFTLLTPTNVTDHVAIDTDGLF